jgi:hypothetical protein
MTPTGLSFEDLTPAAPSAAEVPLIWTTLGNVPVHALQHQVKWEHTRGGMIRFGEIYKTAGGLVVKETWHDMPASLLLSDPPTPPSRT